jgi:hypothetical protein
MLVIGLSEAIGNGRLIWARWGRNLRWVGVPISNVYISHAELIMDLPAFSGAIRNVRVPTSDVSCPGTSGFGDVGFKWGDLCKELPASFRHRKGHLPRGQQVLDRACREHDRLIRIWIY